jgi:hypothetical protein
MCSVPRVASGHRARKSDHETSTTLRHPSSAARASACSACARMRHWRSGPWHAPSSRQRSRNRSSKAASESPQTSAPSLALLSRQFRPRFFSRSRCAHDACPWTLPQPRKILNSGTTALTNPPSHHHRGFGADFSAGCKVLLGFCRTRRLQPQHTGHSAALARQSKGCWLRFGEDAGRGSVAGTRGTDPLPGRPKTFGFGWPSGARLE